MKKVILFSSLFIVILLTSSSLYAQTVTINQVSDTLRFTHRVLQAYTDSLILKITRTADLTARSVTGASLESGINFTIETTSGDVTDDLMDTVVTILRFTPNTTGLFIDKLIINFSDGDYAIYIKGKGAALIFGDVNENNKINSTDAAYVLMNVVSKTPPGIFNEEAADVTNFSGVTSYDASYILRYAVELISEFPGVSNLAKSRVIVSSVGFDNNNIKESGDNIIIPINVTGENIYSIEGSFSFDKNLLEYEGLYMSNINMKSMVFDEKEENGSLKFALASFQSFNTKGDVIFLKFKIRDLRKGKGRLTVEKFLVNEYACDIFGVNLDKINNVPYDYYLSQNYPNPFNSETIIKYGLSKKSFVSLTIYNLSGQEVITLVNEELNAGKYEVTWNGRNSIGQEVASGIYLYVIKANEFRKVNKMIYVK